MLIDGIFRKLVIDADCGIYVEPEDMNSFVKNLRFYKNNPNTINVHVANGV